jgi:hypothetical protein
MFTDVSLGSSIRDLRKFIERWLIFLPIVLQIDFGYIHAEESGLKNDS